MVNCASKEVDFDKQFNDLQAHMTFDQVKQLLGPPNLREVKPKSHSPGAPTVEAWHYSKADGRVVLFEDGLVTAFGKDGVINSDINNSTDAKIIVAPRAIGESCNADKDCLEHNCHFHICSGKNNCQVAAGGVCATDQDCCTGKCDFGICKKR